jgi:hypothetical protein
VELLNHFCTNDTDLDVVQFLVERRIGAEPSRASSAVPPLATACKAKATSIVKFLLSQELYAVVHQPCSAEQRPPLIVAAELGLSDVVVGLLAANVDPNLRFMGATVLSTALMACPRPPANFSQREGYSLIVLALLKGGANLLAGPTRPMRYLQLALSKGLWDVFSELVRILVNLGSGVRDPTPKALGPDRRQNLTRLFQFLDDNGDGFLCANDPAIFQLAYALLRQRHPTWSDRGTNSLLGGLFSAADTNEDGKLDLDEFIESFISGYGVLPDDYVDTIAPRLAKQFGEPDFRRVDAILEVLLSTPGLCDPSTGFCTVENLLLPLAREAMIAFPEDPATVQSVLEGVTAFQSSPSDSQPPVVNLLHLASAFRSDRNTLSFPLLVTTEYIEIVSKIVCEPVSGSPSSNQTPSDAGSVEDTEAAFVLC